MNNHEMADLQLGEYLGKNNIGVFEDGDYTVGSGHFIVAGLLPPEPDEAIGIMGPWQDDLYEENSVIRLMVAIRGKPWDIAGPRIIANRIYDLLHEQQNIALTADQEVLLCRRITKDAPAQDENRRYIRVDTYSMRMAAPTNV